MKKYYWFLALVLSLLQVFVVPLSLNAVAQETSVGVYSEGEDGLPLEDVSYRPAESQFMPNLTDWGWTDHISRTDTSTGVRIVHKSDASVNSAFQNWINKAYAVNGMHFKYTLNSTVWNQRLLILYLKNSGDNTSTNLTFKVETYSGAVYIGSKAGAVDHSQIEGYNGTLKDRIYTGTMGSERQDYEWRFYKMADGGLLVNVNGFEFTVPAAVVEGSQLNLDNAYLTISSDVGAVDYTLNYIHGGNEICSKLIEEINAVPMDDVNSPTAIRLYTKAVSLSEDGKNLLKNWRKLNSAVQDITDTEYYKLRSTDVTHWWNLISDVDDGVRISINTDNYAYRHTLNKEKSVDGLTAVYTLHSGYFYLALVKGTPDGLGSVPLAVKFEGDNLYVLNNNKQINRFDYAVKTWTVSDTDVRVVVSNRNPNEQRNTVSFAMDHQKRLSMYLNGVKAFTLTAQDTAALGLTEKMQLQIAPTVSSVDMTLHYVRGGNEFAFDRVTDGLYNKITTADLRGSGWWGYESTIENGVKIQVPEGKAADWSFAVQTAKVQMDGLTVGIKLHSGVFFLQLDDNVNNPSDWSTAKVTMKIERSGKTVLYRGSTVLATVDGTDAFRNAARVDVRIAMTESGELQIYYDDVLVFTMAAVDVAASGLPADGYVKFTSQGSGHNLDVFYVRSGYYVNQMRFGKPVCVPGDANMDGEADIRDLVLLNEYIEDTGTDIYAAAVRFKATTDPNYTQLDEADLTGERKLLLGIGVN